MLYNKGMIHEFDIEINSENLKPILIEWLPQFAEIETAQIHYTTLLSGPFDTLENKAETLKKIALAVEIKQIYFTANAIEYSVLIDDVSIEFVLKNSILNSFTAEQELNKFMDAIKKAGFEAKVLEVMQPY